MERGAARTFLPTYRVRFEFNTLNLFRMSPPSRAEVDASAAYRHPLRRGGKGTVVSCRQVTRPRVVALWGEVRRVSSYPVAASPGLVSSPCGERWDGYRRNLSPRHQTSCRHPVGRDGTGIVVTCRRVTRLPRLEASVCGGGGHGRRGEGICWKNTLTGLVS